MSREFFITSAARFSGAFTGFLDSGNLPWQHTSDIRNASGQSKINKLRKSSNSDFDVQTRRGSAATVTLIRCLFGCIYLLQISLSVNEI
jgi:hypothetical protein